MTLENLWAINRLHRLEPDHAAIRRLLVSAESSLADAGVPRLTAASRFDLAYKSIMQCAMAALWSCGYRTVSSQPGHHQTAIQVLPKTAGVRPETIIVLDALRKQRNLCDYEGNDVPQAMLEECLSRAADLLEEVRSRIAKPR